MATNTNKRSRTTRQGDPAPSVAADLPPSNPLQRINWPEEPETSAALELWMTRTQTALKTWLVEANARAQDTTISEGIERQKETLDNVWCRYEPLTDSQTGHFFREGAEASKIEQEKEIMKEMKTESLAMRRLHKGLRTWHKHLERRYAQAAWEDFLYYQNAWKRRGFRNKEVYCITKPEKEQQKQNANLAKTEASNKLSWINRNGVEGDGYLANDYFAWRDHMILLYTEFEFADRGRIPAVVDPELAHRYSRPPQGTTDKKKGGNNATELVHCTVDTKAYGKLSLQKEAEYRAKNPDTSLHIARQLLPPKHVPHQSSRENNSDWPTSFESRQWGDIIAITGSRKRYLYEDISDAEKTGEKETKYKRDKRGNKIRKIDDRPRYKRKLEKKDGQVFVHETNPDGTVKGRDLNSLKWIGAYELGDVETEDWEKDKKGERVKLPIRYFFKREFRIVRTSLGRKSWTTRHDRHNGVEGTMEHASGEQATVDTQGTTEHASGEEATGETRAGASEKDATPDTQVQEPDMVDEFDSVESDDEDDIFTISYRQGSFIE